VYSGLKVKEGPANNACPGSGLSFTEHDAIPDSLATISHHGREMHLE
jgi:hypothetical protein